MGGLAKPLCGLGGGLGRGKIGVKCCGGGGDNVWLVGDGTFVEGDCGGNGGFAQ